MAEVYSLEICMRQDRGPPRYISSMDEKRALLRHTLATLAYRAARAFEDAPAQFGEFSGAGRQPVQILAHMGDLFDWALSAVQGNERWHTSKPHSWVTEQQRFFASLHAFDAYLASYEPLYASAEALFQGPIADALTHVGQLAMLRRMAGSPICGENYYVAEIKAGQVGSEQSVPVQPFRRRAAAAVSE